MTTWTLTFIESHPLYAFFLAWPIGLVIISLSWQFAITMENAMNLILRLVNLASNTFILIVRGYAPLSAEAEEVDKKEKDES